MTTAVLDDHLLRDLLADDTGDEFARLLVDHEPATTNLYLHRLCKSIVAARGGALTGSWSAERRRALGARLVQCFPPETRSRDWSTAGDEDRRGLTRRDARSRRP